MATIGMDEEPGDDLDYDSKICVCGESWYTLEGPRPAICLNRFGKVTGYSGVLVCSTCGKQP